MNLRVAHANQSYLLGATAVSTTGVGILDSVSNLLSPKQGRVIDVQAAPTALSAGIIAALGLGLIAVAVMKKKRMF